jgi:hypothetical protein
MLSSRGRLPEGDVATRFLNGAAGAASALNGVFGNRTDHVEECEQELIDGSIDHCHD